MRGGRRVLVFRERFLPPSETFVRDHVNNLPTWRPAVLTTQRVQGGLETSGIPVLDTSAPPLTFRIARGIARRLRVTDPRSLDLELTLGIRRSRAEVVHAWFGPDAVLMQSAARRAGVPLVATFPGFDASMHWDALRQTAYGARLADGWESLVEEAAALTTVSRFLRDEMVDRGADPERLHVVPLGVQTGKLPWSPPPVDGPLLFVGRLVDKKGCADLLQAASLQPRRRRIRIIGDGPLRAELEEQARRLRVDAEFLGVQNSDQVRSAMQAASCVVMPSQRAADGDCEGLPVVSLEASAMGRPVVGYEHSGMVESIISGKTGLLAPERDVEGLAAALEALDGNGPELLRLSRNARRHIEDNFELVSCLEQLEAVYAKVASASR